MFWHSFGRESHVFIYLLLWAWVQHGDGSGHVPDIMSDAATVIDLGDGHTIAVDDQPGELCNGGKRSLGPNVAR